MIIGITGNIGAGKSTFTKIFSVMSGIPAFDGDFISKYILATYKDAINRICSHYGKPAEQEYEDFLKEHFFVNEVLQKEIENFVCPRFWEYAAGLEETHGNILLESAIIFEKHDQNKLDAIIGVDAENSIRSARLQARGMTQEDAFLRMQRQLPFRQYASACRYIVENNSNSILNLVTQSHQIITTIYE